MPEPQRSAAPAAGGPTAAGGQEEESTFKRLLGIAQFFSPSTKPATPVKSNGDPNVPTVDPWMLPPAQAELAWALGQPLDMHVHLTTASLQQVFNKPNWLKEQDKDLPTFVWSNITFGDWNAVHTAEFDVKFPKSVLNNGSLWMDVFLTKGGTVPDPRHASFDPENIHHIRKLLTPYLAKAKVRKEKKLLGGSAETPETPIEEPEDGDTIVPHWYRNITLALVSDAAKVPYASLPPPVSEHVYLTPERDATATQGFYRPIVFPNEFWHLREHYTELNSTTLSLPLQVVFQPMSYFKFQMFAAMTNGFKEAAKQQGASAGAELDELKRMLTETNPWFLALTGFIRNACVQVGRLALASEEGDGWRFCQIVTNVFVQVVVLLYLIDNNENTSWMILFGSGTGVLIEAWKVTKAVDISVIPASAGSLIPYKLDIKGFDPHGLRARTDPYYQAQLVPQLIINYKLKRWIYRIDPKRVNEYGQVMAEDVAAVDEKDKKKETRKNK
ncbi:hypothetical protein H0H87_009350 [Tephrocybe sp. NHM501043]|nr:hypothetical protein H0H87_009350 [Tephrocybe sp. NHM501043]